MRGSIRKRGEDRYQLVLEFGYQPDLDTGRPRRIQKYESFRGTLREAEARLNKLVREAQDGTYIEPDKRTVGQWLDEWVDLAIKPPFKTQRAYDTYKSVIALHLR